MTRRMVGLLALLAAMLLVRWLLPPAPTSEEPALAKAVKPASWIAQPPALAASADTTAPKLAAARQDEDADVIGNAFEVRGAVVAMPPPSPPPPVVAVASPALPVTPTVSVDAAPAPQPLPPLEVIGTWNDGTGPAVFIAGAQGTLLARTGTVLLSEYRVTAVTEQQVSLQHIASNRELALHIPRVSTHP